MIITIDGPAAAGKGTLAQRLAEKYRLAYFDKQSSSGKIVENKAVYVKVN